MGVLKRPALGPGNWGLWAATAYCRGKDPAMWDLDSKDRTVARGRLHCLKDCTIREECLRRALRDSDYGTYGVVRGGVRFNDVMRKKQRTVCLFCHWPIAPIEYNRRGEQIPSLCTICRNYAPCLKGCGRMVRRKPNIGSYHCKYCAT